MGTDAAVSYGEPLITLGYHADGQETTNGIARVRKELLCVLREKGFLDRKEGSFELVLCAHGGTKVHYRIRVLDTNRTFHAEAPACLGEVIMDVYEV